LKTIGDAIFNVVVGITTIVALFYLAGITHILPLPENALGLIDEFSLYAWAVLLACGDWLITSLSFLATFRGLAILILISALVLSFSGRKIYRFFESSFGGILFWGCVLVVAGLCAAAIGYADRYMLPLVLMALLLLLYIVVEHQRSRL
jgi:hypothetical protein